MRNPWPIAASTLALIAALAALGVALAGDDGYGGAADAGFSFFEKEVAGPGSEVAVDAGTLSMTADCQGGGDPSIGTTFESSAATATLSRTLMFERRGEEMMDYQSTQELNGTDPEIDVAAQTEPFMAVVIYYVEDTDEYHLLQYHGWAEPNGTCYVVGVAG